MTLHIASCPQKFRAAARCLDRCGSCGVIAEGGGRDINAHVDTCDEAGGARHVRFTLGLLQKQNGRNMPLHGRNKPSVWVERNAPFTYSQDVTIGSAPFWTCTPAPWLLAMSAPSSRPVVPGPSKSTPASAQSTMLQAKRGKEAARRTN